MYNVTVTFVNSLGKESELRTHSKSIKDRRESSLALPQRSSIAQQTNRLDPFRPYWGHGFWEWHTCHSLAG